MGTVIDTLSVKVDESINSSIEYSAQTAAECMKAASVDEDDIGLLISIGIYKDSNISEPSQAAVIQKPAGLNLDPREKSPEGSYRKYFMRDGTFSFDLMNSACGFINAAQIVDSFLKNGSVKSGLIVASDVHPSKKTDKSFPYSHAGAAALLVKSSNGSGFKKFMYETSEDEDYTGLDSYFSLKTHGADGRNHVEISVEPDFAEKLQSFSSRKVAEYVAKEDIDVSRIKYLVTNQGEQAFAEKIADAIGLDKECIIKLNGGTDMPLTAAPIMGFQEALERGLEDKEQVLFVSASAGLTFASCIYEQ